MPDDLAEPGPYSNGSSRPGGRPGDGKAPQAGVSLASRAGAEGDDPGWVVETIVSPFHCLYQDALHFHTQSRLAYTEAEAARLARASFMLYIASAEALVRQAAVELGRPELRGLLADPSRPLPPAEAWRLLPAIVAEPGVPTQPFNFEAPPWPQFAELLMLETSWVYPGPPSTRRAFYRSSRRDGDYEPLEPHQVPPALRRVVRTESLTFPRTGLPRDPYALRPRHLDTARGVLDAAIEALDRRMGGVLCQDKRHRREPTRLITPPGDAT
ncbi:hypothetical protein [Paludisphaera mucosa]|uniref:HEPN domain-containing protein n=1 Tax=Paludisphaera mucosa TaxID=3030827 RepID=A0ABT6FAG1_9BACT|nr:hypothetical protein [Paludisphaera mucosa]MDG3004466.1 hypothetical protein [Paludisphaera mucosa]